VATGEHEVAALLGESESDGTADAAARSGHERDLSLQPKLHSPPPHACSDADGAVVVNLSHWRGGGWRGRRAARVMPLLRSGRSKDGDGRDEPGHHEVTARSQLRSGPRSYPEPR